MKKEIGGYLEFEHFSGQEYYPNYLKFNLGRTAITHFFQEVGCKTLYLPYFLCDSVTVPLKASGITLKYYHINEDFTPVSEDLPKGPLLGRTWLFVVNYYGQLSDALIASLKQEYQQVLFDMTHAFFQIPRPEIDAVFSMRKFFGLPDGAYLKTNREIEMPEDYDTSWERFRHLLGRYEESASAHYEEMLETAHGFVGAKPLLMSPLTENLLQSFQYQQIAHKRMKNYMELSRGLQFVNPLSRSHILRIPDAGPFCYPLMVSRGPEIRKRLADEGIFVPTYWKNVMETMPEDSLEYQYAANILPIPCDQRYDRHDMKDVLQVLLSIPEVY